MAERWLRWLGGLADLLALASVLLGLWRGLGRPVGRLGGAEPRALRSPGFYLLIGTLYFGACAWLWRPLPLDLTPAARWAALLLGSLLHFIGAGLVLWGRLALGKFYGVSSSFGAHLYSNHQLVRSGPYAIVRHPMYLGLLLIGVGGLLLYRTWTFAFVAVTFLSLARRARLEEQVLAAEFGEQWEAYCRQVPAWFPRVRHFRSLFRCTIIS